MVPGGHAALVTSNAATAPKRQEFSAFAITVHSELIKLQAGSAAGSALLGLLGIVVQDANVLIGVNCSPITVIGVGSGSSCSAEVVCCSDNSYVSRSTSNI